jgi:predicted dehydrogenase
MLARSDIEAILNLTTPQFHAKVNQQCLNAGKHVYLEKPLALNVKESEAVLALAEKKGLRVGCAPDTFFGGGLQTCRKLVDDGWIGQPLSGVAFMTCFGHESWHPAPEFYYLNGGGPLFDMGPYYLTALVNLLGPVKKVAAMGKMGFKERVCSSEKRMGDKMPVDVNTHITGSLEFENGAIITLIMSFDVAQAKLPRIELHGTKGSLSIPDPNTFGGPVVYGKAKVGFEPVPLTHGYTDNMRSIGLADMITGIGQGRPHRASGALAHHVLEIMCALEESSASEVFVSVKSRCQRPEALPTGLFHGELD